MAIILNLETATTVCSVSLAKDGELMALKEINGDYSHAENLTVFIEDVFNQANVKLNEVDAIAVSKGPGSYTGLRIGVSTAKGLCYSLNKPLIAIDTLQHMALSVSSNQQSTINNQQFLFCPMLDARRMEVYCAMYDSNNNCVVPTAAIIIDENSFTDFVKGKAVCFFGDGAAKCEHLIKGEEIYFLTDIFPSTKNMISLSEKAFNNKQFEDVAYFEPFYLKDFMIGKKKGEK